MEVLWGAAHDVVTNTPGLETTEDASGKYEMSTNSFGVWAKDLDKKTPTDQSMLDGQAYEKVDPAEVEAKAVVIKSTSLMPEGQERFAPAQVDDFEGFWGKVSWFLSPNVGRGQYDWDGNYVGIAPIGGTAPVPSFTGLKAVNTIKVLQTGGHTLKSGTLKVLGLTKEQGKNAIEALKKVERLSSNFHGKIMSNGDLIHPHTNRIIGNLFDYLP